MNDKQAVKKIDKVSNRNNLHFMKQFASKKDYVDYVKSKFPLKNGVDYSAVKVSKIGDYSITRPQFADNISTLIKSKFIILAKNGKESKESKENGSITDATAGMGGNTLSFAKHFAVVNSVEYDPYHCDFLKNNVKVYGYSSKVDVYCESYLDIGDKLKQDIIFFDPPWGGEDYMKRKMIDLFIGDVNVVDIIEKRLRNGEAKLVALKAPRNFDFDKLKKIKNSKGAVHNVRNYKLALVWL